MVTHNAGFARAVASVLWHFDALKVSAYSSYAAFLRLRQEAEDKATRSRWRP